MTATAEPRSAHPKSRFRWMFVLALAALITVEVLRVYWIMPFPGSQSTVKVDWAYALHQWIWPARILFWPILLITGFVAMLDGRWLARGLATIGLIAIGVVTYFANGPMSADRMFLQPGTLTFVDGAGSPLPGDALVITIVMRDASGMEQARAYPIRYIGYHHQVRDELAGQPVLVSYCTVCRTGRVFSPTVDGVLTEFRLVGMDRFNAMFEDQLTKSWWRQANGAAVAGYKKGAVLPEIPSRQMSLATFRTQHPDGTVMAPDPAFKDTYERMKDYDTGARPSALTGRNFDSWQDKSWVVGVRTADGARAFDWNELAAERVLHDDVGTTPVIVMLDADGSSFAAFDARVNGARVRLARSDIDGEFVDETSGLRFGADGRAKDPSGQSLLPLPAYQEFWHSWQTFQPNTTARR